MMVCDCKDGDRIRMRDGVTGMVTRSWNSPWSEPGAKYAHPTEVLRDNQPAGSKPTKYAFPYKIGCPGYSVEVL